MILNFRDENMEDICEHRTRTLSVTSASSVLSCSTIPPVTIQHLQMFLDRLLS